MPRFFVRLCCGGNEASHRYLAASHGLFIHHMLYNLHRITLMSWSHHRMQLNLLGFNLLLATPWGKMSLIPLCNLLKDYREF